MENHYLEKLSKLNSENINQNQVTLSLMQEAHRVGLLSGEKVSDLQALILNTLSGCIMDFTGGESSSVKEETAQSLLQSVLFCMDVFLVGISDPDEAANCFLSMPIKDIYLKGKERVRAITAEAQNLYADVYRGKLDVPLTAYQDTILEALPDFFKQYEPEFHAQDTPCSIDYPIAFDETHRQGILYIRQYLGYLLLENEFCALFGVEDIAALLEEYGSTYHTDYKELLINIYEIVLTNCIAKGMLKSDLSSPQLSRAECDLLAEKLQAVSNSAYSACIEDGINTVLQELKITNPALQNYIKKQKELLLPRLVSAIEKNTLHLLFVTRNEGQKGSVVHFKEGTKMDNAKFRSVVARILRCENGAEKAAVMVSSVHSIADFCDILSADCIFGDEFPLVFDALGDLALSLLVVKVFEETLRGTEEIDFDTLPETEKEWQSHLARYLKKMNSARKKGISDWANENHLL